MNKLRFNAIRFLTIPMNNISFSGHEGKKKHKKPYDPTEWFVLDESKLDSIKIM